MKILIKALTYFFVTLLITSCYQKVPEPIKSTPDEINRLNDSSAHNEATFVLMQEKLKTTLGGGCNFDLIAGQPRDLPSINVQRTDATLLFTGWAVVSMDDENPGKDVWLTLTGPKDYQIKANRVERGDVANYFKKKNLSMAGFEVTTSLSNIDAGEYTISILVEGEASIYDCEVSKRISIL